MCSKSRRQKEQSSYSTPPPTRSRAGRQRAPRSKASPSKPLKRIAREGETRIHTSPPSAANIAAGRNAVALNWTHGDHRRARLVRLVGQLRTELRKLDLQSRSELPIPMQVIAMPSLRAAKAARASLDENGVRALVTRCCLGDLPSLTLLITALHAPADI